MRQDRRYRMVARMPRAGRKRLMRGLLVVGVLIGVVVVLRVAAAVGCWGAVGDGGKPGFPSKAGPPAVPEETADVVALSKLANWHLLPVFDHGVYQQQSSAERTHLPRFDGLTMLSRGNRDMNNFVCVSDDAERIGQERVPVVAELERCPETHVRGFVISRFEGSGRLARLWLTSTSVFKLHGRDELLRIYVDNRTEPWIQVPLVDAIYGRAHEIFAPPFGAGSRFFLAWYYPVVFGSRLVISIDRVRLGESYYHQTDVVLDRRPSPRVAAASRLDLRDRAVATLRGRIPDKTSRHRRTLKLAPGQRATAFDLQGPGTIQQVSLRVAERRPLSQVRLQVRWDDCDGVDDMDGDDGGVTAVDPTAHRAAPAIDLPILALFASDLDTPAKSSLALGSSSGEKGGQATDLWLRLPMPYRSRALWTLENAGSHEASLELTLAVEKALPEGSWGHLHTQFFETRGPAETRYHPLAKASGRGRLVGTCLSMQGHGLDPVHRHADPYNFLEGDERGVIDGKLAILGTGTEDYFNSSFYFADGNFGTPFAQATKAKPSSDSRVVACRWHLLGDAIDFAEDLDLRMEIGPGQPSLLDRYRSVAFVYQ